MLQTQRQDLVENEMNELTAEYQQDKLEFIKNSVVAEFLGLASNTDFTKSDLEKSILSNLQKIPNGAWQRLCFCCKTAAYSYGKTGLLYRPCIL